MLGHVSRAGRQVEADTGRRIVFGRLERSQAEQHFDRVRDPLRVFVRCAKIVLSDETDSEQCNQRNQEAEGDFSSDQECHGRRAVSKITVARSGRCVDIPI